MIIDNPRPFTPKLNWNDHHFQHPKPEKQTALTGFPNKVAQIIEAEIGYSPLNNYHYQGQRFVKARYLFINMMVKYTNWTYTEIGKLIRKDHSTVNHSLKYITDYLATDSRFVSSYNIIDTKVKELKKGSTSNSPSTIINLET
jgi:hypothetical protein